MIPRKNNQMKRTGILKGVECYQGETLMETLRKKKLNKETMPVIMDTFYTNKADGVQNSLNIRADRFDIGIKEAERLQDYKRRKREYLMKAGTGGASPTKGDDPGEMDTIG